MAFHIIQAQHSSAVIVVMAFVFLLRAPAQLVLDHLKKKAHLCSDIPSEALPSVGSFNKTLVFNTPVMGLIVSNIAHYTAS